MVDSIGDLYIEERGKKHFRPFSENAHAFLFFPNNLKFFLMKNRPILCVDARKVERSFFLCETAVQETVSKRLCASAKAPDAKEDLLSFRHLPLL